MDRPTGFLYQQPKGSKYLIVAQGKTAVYSCEADPRVSFCLYIPTTHPVSQLYRGMDTVPPKEAFQVLVHAHHAGLNGQSGRDDWSEWAEENQVVILSPIFPYVFQDGTVKDCYKVLTDPEGHISYDKMLLNMLETAQREWGYLDINRFSLTGYSAGGQFSFRFWYLHPERVKTLAFGAPGTQTVLDDTQDWPAGVKNTQEIFGVRVTPEALKVANTRIQVCIGELDTSSSDPRYAIKRPDIVDNICKGFEASGIPYDKVTLPGVGHEGLAAAMKVQAPFLKAGL